MACLLVAACQQVGAGAAKPKAGVVARFGALEITVDEMDARILALPASERPRPGQDLDAWYRSQIRDLAVDHELREEAASSHVDQEKAFLDAQAEARKQLTVQLCVAPLLPRIEDLSEEDLRAAYDREAERFSSPERRAVYNIFLRTTPERPRAQARAVIEALRDRVLNGESFQRLASEHSDSESRHREGSIGWVVQGQLPAGFEKVIFGLEEGVPSEPVATRDGFHLFYVDQVLAARQIPFDEARNQLRKELVAERQEAALADLEAQVEPPPGAVLLGRKAFVKIARSDEQDAVVLDVGDTKLTLGDVREHVRQVLAHSEAPNRLPAIEVAWKWVTLLRRAELLSRQCQSDGKVAEGEVEAKLKQWREAALLDIQRRRRSAEVAKQDEEKLRLFYQSNVGEFSKPPQWHLRVLSLPMGEDAVALMARLEVAASRQDTGLDRLQAELGGEIEDLGSKGLAELQIYQPKLPAAIAPLAVGGITAPYRTRGGLQVAELLDKREAEPEPFEEVRDRVAAAYVQQYTHEVYEQLADEILGKDRLQIVPEGLQALREAGLPKQDISVDELEALINEL